MGRWMFVVVLGLLLAVQSACTRPSRRERPPYPPEGAPTLNVRLVIVDPWFSTPIASFWLSDRVDAASWLLAEHGIRLTVVGREPVDRPEWVDVEAEDTPAMRAWAGTGVQTIFLVRNLDYKGASVGGLGYRRPINCLILARNSCVDVLAHELGHACGLVHTESGCNTMRGSSCCVDSTFTPEQGEQLKACAADKSFAASRGREDGEPFVCSLANR